jgi:hypothetical protein
MPEKKYKYLNEEELEEARSLTPEVAVGLPLTDRRINFIAQLMASLRWVKGWGGTVSELAEIWAIAPRTVANMQSTASREFKRAAGESEDLRDLLIVNLQHIARDSMEGHKPDRKAAVAAIKEIADLAGLKVKKHEHSHNHNYQDMSVTELLQEAELFRERKLLNEQQQYLGDGSIDTEGRGADEPKVHKKVYPK